MKRSSDWLIALAVIACSVALLAALTVALTGNPFARPTRTLRVQLPDITGLQTSSLVKYAGATAGTIRTVRILTPAERLASSDSANAIELTLAIANGVPEFSGGTSATVSANTLLADKFVLLSAGDPAAPPLENNALIPGLPPTTIDSLVQTIDQSLRGLETLLPGDDDSVLPGLIESVNSLLTEARATVTQLDALVASAGTTLTSADGLLVTADASLSSADTTLADARNLIAKTDALVAGDTDSLQSLIADLTTAADRIDALAARAARLIDDNADNLDATLADARIATENLKVTATYAKALTLSLTKRPQQLLWGPGRNPIRVPAEGEILSAEQSIRLD